MSRALFALLATGVFCAAQSATPNPQLRFHTNLGDINVTLTYDKTPKTVTNFLNYMNQGAYTNGIINRSIPGFVIQAGGYTLASDGSTPQTTANVTVASEAGQTNARGTIAMALAGSPPDLNSGTNQFFFNLVDNNANNSNSAADLDHQGFTVFGSISDAASLAVMDAIAKLGTYNTTIGSNTPLQNYTGTGTVPAPSAGNYVVIKSIEQIVAIPSPTISNAISASAFGAFPNAASGSYVEIYGANLSNTTRSWATSDFTGAAAPQTVDGVSATVNGLAAYVSYVSPTQVNIQIPDGVSRGAQVPIILTRNGFVGAAFNMEIDRTAPGLLAPASFNVNGKQYLAAQHASGALVANSSIKGVAAAPAAPGETLQIYGIGWGPVTNTQDIAGSINSRQATLDATITFTIGGINAQVQYAGLSPGLVGVDQFNVVVPPTAANGDLPVVASLNGVPIAQTLYLPVQK